MAPTTRRSANTPKAEKEVVDLSSDTSSDYGVYLEKVDEQATTGKRKSGGQDEEPSSANKRQKLPVRVKSTTKTTPSGGRQVSIEIPLPTSSATKAAKRKGAAAKEVKDSEEEEDESNDVFKTPMERKHLKFDDDDHHEEFMTPLERPAAKMAASQGGVLEDVVEDDEDDEESESEEEEEESDDDAPEAISTSAAAAQSEKLAQAAAKAVEKQDADKKRKRQERDAKMQRQAKERKVALAKAMDVVKAAEAAQQQSSDSESEAEEEPVPRKKKRDIPSILPPEFLESDDEDEDENDAMHLDVSRRPAKITFGKAERDLAKESRAPADQRIGGTVYRVAADQGEKKLAPKIQKHTMSAKSDLLNRNRAPVKRKGFLVR